ncbi:helicase-related protein [Rubritalea marina]|uniref:helicase-related protein n=1 Tax=Rubritalea marina TaxID=361055 RepID=UPI000365F436|nr:DEAD/DEAH box helicase [Rubritalea marina]
MATHALYEVYDPQKNDLLSHLLMHQPELMPLLVILRSREAVHALAAELAAAGLKVDSVHGKKKPELVERALLDFKAGGLELLVATDALIRNLDLSGVRHMLHIDFPELWQDYQDRWQLVQAEDGVLLSFSTPDGSGALKAVEEVLGGEIPRTKAEGFLYEGKPPRQNPARNKTPKRGERSKPLQHKKKKWKPKKYGRH